MTIDSDGRDQDEAREPSRLDVIRRRHARILQELGRGERIVAREADSELAAEEGDE